MKTPSSLVSSCGSVLPFAERISHVSSLPLGFAEVRRCPLLREAPKNVTFFKDWTFATEIALAEQTPASVHRQQEH